MSKMRLPVDQGTLTLASAHIKELGGWGEKGASLQPSLQLWRETSLMYDTVSSQREFLMSRDTSCLTTSAGIGQ